MSELLLRHEPLALEVGDPTLIGALYARLSHRVLISGAYRASIDMATRALAAADEGGDAESAILAAVVQERGHAFLCELARAIELHGELRARLAVAYYPMWDVYTQGGVALGLMMAGRFDEALEAFGEGVAAGERLSAAA